MLIIVVNRFPGIKQYCQDKKLFTDAFLYDLFNGDDGFRGDAFDESFKGDAYSIDDLERFMADLWGYAQGATFDVVLHTFNPMVINYLEQWLARESVFYYEAGELKPVFGAMPGCDEKLAVMGPGEAVADTLFPQENN